MKEYKMYLYYMEIWEIGKFRIRVPRDHEGVKICYQLRCYYKEGTKDSTHKGEHHIYLSGM